MGRGNHGWRSSMHSRTICSNDRETRSGIIGPHKFRSAKYLSTCYHVLNVFGLRTNRNEYGQRCQWDLFADVPQ